MSPGLIVELVGLLILVHGAPVVTGKFAGQRWAYPVDNGRVLRDGYRLLGASKTWRGILVALGVSAATAGLLGLGAFQGALFGAAAMMGDLLSSFIKRRLGLPASAKATGLDQIPESLLPLLLGMSLWGYGWHAVFLGVFAFFVLEVTLSPLLFRLGIRRRPY